MSSSNTYTHLRDGSWGVRFIGTAKPGQLITVTKKDGDKKEERVEKVLWTGRDAKTSQTICICAIKQQARSTRDERGNSDMVRCRHCHKMTQEGDDWCMVCGRADYER